MATSKMKYEFRNPDIYTPALEVAYAHVNRPDPTYGDYKITMRLPVDAPETKQLLKDTLDFENSVRASQGIDAAEYPSNWTKRGKPRLSEDGKFWEVEAKLAPTNSKGVAQSPEISDVYGETSTELSIWGGDIVSVCFGIGVWYDKFSAGTRYFLKGVQLLKKGERNGSGGGGVNFKDRSAEVGVSGQQIADYAARQEGDGQSDDDGSDVPF